MSASARYHEITILRLVDVGLMSRETAHQEVKLHPHTPEPPYMDTRWREHLIDLVEAGLLSKHTAISKLGIGNPEREYERLYKEQIQNHPAAQALVLQTAQRIARAKYPWRYRN